MIGAIQGDLAVARSPEKRRIARSSRPWAHRSSSRATATHSRSATTRHPGRDRRRIAVGRVPRAALGRDPGAVSARPDLAQPIRDRWAASVPFEDVPLLTDDYAPTDALLLLFG